MRKKTFLINALLLTITGLLTHTIGMAFRIYMSNKIGAEGIGLYQLISTIYFFSATFATSGISLAVTRLVTDAMAKKDYSKVKPIVRKCLFLGITISIISGTVLFIFADFISNSILKDTRAVLSLKILAPSLPFMAISSCFRGYFYAVRKAINTAGEQLFEQIVEISVFIFIIGGFAPMGTEYSCCAIVIGTTAAEVLSFGYSLLFYAVDVHKYKAKNYSNPGSMKKIFSISIPVTASSFIKSGLSTVENILIPGGLKKFGSSSDKSLSGYGMITGMVMPVISFPSVLLSSFSMLLIPELSEANTVNHKLNIKYIASRIFQITLLFSIMASGIFFFFSEDLGKIIYFNEEAGTYIKILAPIVPFIYLDFVVDGMLKGLNEQIYSLSFNLIDSAVSIVMIYILLPIRGLNGLIIVMFASTILNSFLTISRLIKVTELNISVLKCIIKPILSIVLSGIFICSIFDYNLIPFCSFAPLVILKIFFTIICYIGLIFITKSINRDDVYWFLACFRRKT